MSYWIVMLHKRCQHFQHVAVDDESMAASVGASLARGSSSASKHLFGAQALRYRFERCQSLAAGQREESDLKELRQFKWMLTAIELKSVEEWTRSKVVSSKAKIMNRHKALNDVENKFKENKRQGDNGDQSQCVIAPPLKRIALENRALDTTCEIKYEDGNDLDENGDCTEMTGVLSLFGAKAL